MYLWTIGPFWHGYFLDKFLDATEPEVKLLRERGASLEAVDEYGRTAMVVAAEVGDAFSS